MSIFCNIHNANSVGIFHSAVFLHRHNADCTTVYPTFVFVMDLKKIEILFENQHWLAINKPSGLLSIPDRFNSELPSAKAIIELKVQNLFVVHRIDKDTSGILFFAKNETAHRHLSILFEKRFVEKKILGNSIRMSTPIRRYY